MVGIAEADDSKAKAAISALSGKKSEIKVTIRIKMTKKEKMIVRDFFNFGQQCAFIPFLPLMAYPSMSIFGTDVPL